MITNLLTKYILAPTVVRLLLFLLFYFIIIKIHYFDVDLSLVECMYAAKKKKSKAIVSEILLEQKDTTLVQKEEISHLTREQKEIRIKELQDLHRTSCELRQPLPILKDLQKQIFDLRESILDAEPKGPIQKALKAYIEALPKTEQDSNLTQDSNYIDPRREVQNLRQHLYGSWFNLNLHLQRNNPIGLISLICQACDKAFVDIETTRQTLQSNETEFAPLLAESKNSILKEVEERIQENFSSVNENIAKRQTDLTDVLKKTFNHKIEQLRVETKNEIISLSNQNQELQNVVNAHVAEIKNQKELTEQLRKSFERKMQAKDLMLQDLQQKNEQLTNQVNRLERIFDRDIRNLQRDIDRILAERTASKIEDLHTFGLPSVSPK